MRQTIPILLLGLAACGTTQGARVISGTPPADLRLGTTDAAATAGAASVNPAAAEPGGGGHQVMALLSGQITFWNAGDLEGFMSGYAEDCEFVSSGGLLRGRGRLLAMYRTSYPPGQMGHLSFNRLDLTPLGSLPGRPRAMFVRGEWKAVPPGGEPRSGLFTLLLREVGEAKGEWGRWRIVVDHTSGLPPDDDPPEPGS